MAEYEVIAEFVDTRTGKRVLPGETTEANKQEAERMKRAKLIGHNLTAEAEEKKKAEEAARLESEKKAAEEAEKKKAAQEKKKQESSAKSEAGDGQ